MTIHQGACPNCGGDVEVEPRPEPPEGERFPWESDPILEPIARCMWVEGCGWAYQAVEQRLVELESTIEGLRRVIRNIGYDRDDLERKVSDLESRQTSAWWERAG